MEYLIKTGQLIDGVADKTLGQHLVHVEGERIKDVFEGEAVPESLEGVPVVDASDYVLMPGLIDCHIHVHTNGEPDRGSFPLTDLPGEDVLRAMTNVRADLRAGYTTLRDCGGMAAMVLRNCRDRQNLVIPRVFAAGYGITATNGHMDWDR